MTPRQYEFSISKYFLPIVLILSLSAVISAYMFLGKLLAIKGSYVFIGVLISTVLYFCARFTRYDTPDWVRENEYTISKLLLLLLLLSITSTVVLETRRPLLLFCFPVAYGLLGVQLYSNPASILRLAEAIGLFSVSLVTKVFEYHRLIGNGDIILHIRAVEKTMSLGSVDTIGRGYSYFPGLHVLSGSTGIVADLSAYDSLIVVGISVAIFLVLLVFLLSRIVSTFSIAIYAGVAATVLKPVHFFSTYVFPQSLAVAFAICILYISYRETLIENTTAVVPLGIIVSCALLFTHHFTVVLALPAVLALSIVPPVINSYEHGIDIPHEPNRVLLWLGVIMAVAYWVFLDVFIGALVFSIRNKIEQDLLISSSSDTVGGLAIGYVLDTQTPVDAVLSLLSPTGVYYILLVAVLSLGMYKLLTSSALYHHPLEILLGLFGSLFMLKTPVLTNARLGHLFAVFFAFVLAFGLKWLFEATENNGVALVSAVLIIGTLGMTAPVAANPDLYDIDSTPEFYDSVETPPRERSLTEIEYKTLAASSSFSEQFSSRVTTDWKSALVLDRFGGELSVPVSKFAEQNMARYRGEAISLESNVLLYRSGWVDHSIIFVGGEFVISRQKKDQIVATHTKIYATDQTGMLWADGVISLPQNASYEN